MALVRGKPHPKAKFTAEEDLILRSLVHQFGENDWERISHLMPNRNQRQCKDRWFCYLSPTVQYGPWTADEDSLLLEKVGICGPKWVRIATYFPTRTDVQVKNRYLVLTRREKKKSVQLTTQESFSVKLLPFSQFATEDCETIPPLRLREGKMPSHEAIHRNTGLQRMVIQD
jgi:hypothetical protein